MEPNSTVIFGISGSISAYKSLDIIRGLRKSNINIRPIFSESAHQFVTPWSIEALSEAPLINQDMTDGKISHLDVCKNANTFVICPASANIIAKLASGLANDLLTSSFLSFTGTKILFPAMHTEMFTNAITQRNIQICRDMGIIVIDPTHGELACGDTGIGRLPDVDLISTIIQFSLLKPFDLTGQRIVITCGGTSEPIDPVRSITNSASGISGHVMANMAAYFGANVTLIRTADHPILDSIHTINVNTASDMETALLTLTDACDTLIMNAAISDFTVAPSNHKLARNSFTDLKITPTNDLLKAFNAKKPAHCKSIGFCLTDSDDILSIAKQKRDDKNCDVIIANGVESFGSPSRTIQIISKHDIQSLQNASLIDVAVAVLTC